MGYRVSVECGQGFRFGVRVGWEVVVGYLWTRFELWRRCDVLGGRKGIERVWDVECSV